MKTPLQRTCAYRHCGETFLDTTPKHNQRYCCVEHRRREKLFRSGKAQDLSYFRGETEPLYHCPECGRDYPAGDGYPCLECRSRRRDKTCSKCGKDFRDESLKNTRRYCFSCSGSTSRRASVSDRIEANRRLRVAHGEGGRLDDIHSLAPNTATWWGRVGELLFLQAYPDARDAIGDYGSRSPFDAQHRDLGRVSIKTAKSSMKRGRETWSFQTHGIRANSDTAFFVGFSEDRTRVVRVWKAPSSCVPLRTKILAPGSSEYSWSAYELPELAPVLDRKFQVLRSKSSPEITNPRVSTEYERVVLGRIGEAIYQKLYPSSQHIAGDDPLAPLDFLDSDGRRVNVRLRRRLSRNRWTFFRSSSEVDDYFFIGLDPSGRVVEALFRVPSDKVPPRGFSVSSNGSSKWHAYRFNSTELPLSVSDVVSVRDLDATHVQISNLTSNEVSNLTTDQRSDLVSRSLSYHRALGFPYPSTPSDARLRSDIRRISEYQLEGDNYPIDNSGLGLCSAYMPHRFDSRNEDADFSALGAFWDDTRLLRALDFCLRGSRPDLTQRGLRSTLTALNRTPTQFRPSVAAALVREYCPKGGLVFDPCAGWGGRLMGTLVSGCRYEGVDTSSKTVDGLHALGTRLCEHLDLDQSDFEVHLGRIENFSKELRADFALTSPPYWLKERYEGAPSDSLETWVDDFLRPMIRKVRGALRSDGHFALNIAPIRVGRRTIPLDEIARKAVLSEGYRLVCERRMLKASFGRQSGGSEPLYIFQRT